MRPTEPDISVVIPTYNELENLKKTLASVFAQDHPNFEVIVVNDGSSDETATYIEQLTPAVPYTPVTQENGGAGVARNTGWRTAKGNLIAFIDSGCVAMPNWLTQLALELQSTAVVGGQIVLAKPHNSLTRYVHAAEHYRHRVKAGRVEYLLTANLGIWREALESVGGFRVWSGVGAEDVDLCYRLRAAGYSLVASEQARILHNDLPDRVRTLSRKYYQRGYANIYYSKTWVAMGFPRSPLRELTKRLAAIVLSPYLGARYAIRTRWQDVPMFIAYAFVEHLSFARGMINALVRFDRLTDNDPSNAPV